MTTYHPVEKLGTKVMKSVDWTVQAFVDGRISTEALLQPDGVESILMVLDAKAGWIQEDESKLLLRKALFRVEGGKDESLRQYTTGRLVQIEAALSSRSGHHANDDLGHSAEGRCAVVHAVRTELQYTLGTAARSSTTLPEHSTCWTWSARRASSRQLSNLWYTPAWKPDDAAEISSVKKRKRKLTSNRVNKSTVLLLMKRWPPAGLRRSERTVSARQRR